MMPSPWTEKKVSYFNFLKIKKKIICQIFISILNINKQKITNFDKGMYAEITDIRQQLKTSFFQCSYLKQNAFMSSNNKKEHFLIYAIFPPLFILK